MKTILKRTGLITAFWALYLPLPAMTSTASLRIEKLNDGFKQIVVELSGFSGTVLIMLSNEKEQALMEEKVPAGESFSKILDLSRLKPGSYFIQVVSELRETVQPLHITSADVILYEEQRMEYFAPTTQLTGRQLDVNWFNTRVATMEVAILDADGVEIFKDTLRNVVRVERRYNLSNLRRGQYTVRLSTPRRSYFQAIEITK